LRLPGGGGFYPAWERAVEQVLEDVKQDRVSAAAAREMYGVVVDVERGEVDEAASAVLRERLRREGTK
jgi:N-methylhydantoinase B